MDLPIRTLEVLEAEAQTWGRDHLCKVGEDLWAVEGEIEELLAEEEEVGGEVHSLREVEDPLVVKGYLWVVTLGKVVPQGQGEGEVVAVASNNKSREAGGEIEKSCEIRHNFSIVISVSEANVRWP